MKYVKMIGLAAVAAMALMAFSAGTASATTLHGVGGAVLPKNTEIDASLTESAKLTAAGVTLDTCTSGTTKGLTANETGETITGEVAAANLTWGGCTNTTTTLEGGTLHIAWTSGNNGKVTGSGFKVTVFTPSIGVTCSYTLGGGTALGELIGGTPATLSINATVKGAPGNSILCPTEAGWVAKYTVTTPTTLTVSN